MEHFHINTNNAITNRITVPLLFSVFKKYSHSILYSLPYNHHLDSFPNVSILMVNMGPYVCIFPVSLVA